MRFFLFLFFFLFSSNSWAIKESQLTLELTEYLLNQMSHRGVFQGEQNMDIHYARFGNVRGKKGSLVFISGRNGFLFKNIELFYDLIREGYSPIYTYDHRDQGLSERFPSKFPSAHVEDFVDYVKDLETFLYTVVKKDPLMDQDNLFAIAHSMGGAVMAHFLQSRQDTTFKAVAFSAPMIRTSLHKYFPGESILLALKVHCMFLPCDYAYQPKNFRMSAPFLPQVFSEEWTSYPNQITDHEALTDSLVRSGFLSYLYEEVFPEASSGTPSLRWLVESLDISIHIMKPWSNKVKIPIFVVQAEEDVVVSNEYQEKFCYDKSYRCCELLKINGKHEIFMETDEVRDKAIEGIFKFFSESEKHQEKCLQAKGESRVRRTVTEYHN